MSTNESAKRLRGWILRYFPDAATDPYGTDMLDAALAYERSAGVERLAADDEHWHRGPGASCSICRFAERSAEAAPIDVLREAFSDFDHCHECDNAGIAWAALDRLEGTDR